MKVKVSIQWVLEDTRESSPKKDDPIFYLDTPNNLVCIVSAHDKNVHIHTNGEMAVWRRTFDSQIAHFSDELSEIGIVCDEDIDHEKYEFHLAPWFDLYDEDGNHLDKVCHSMSQAISEAAIMCWTLSKEERQ